MIEIFHDELFSSWETSTMMKYNWFEEWDLKAYIWGFLHQTSEGKIQGD
jgi:hypothetical protein